MRKIVLSDEEIKMVSLAIESHKEKVVGFIRSYRDKGHDRNFPPILSCWHEIEKFNSLQDKICK